MRSQAPGKKRLPSVRQVFLRSAAVVALLQFSVTLGMAKFQLFPQVEALQINLNETLADNVARSTTRALTRPMVAVQAAVNQLATGGDDGAELSQTVMQQLADSNDAAASVYMLDRTGRVVAVVYPQGESGAGVGNRLALDLSQSEMFRSPEKTKARISPIFLSAVSDRPMIAITAPLVTGGLLAMELSLTRLGQMQNDSAVFNGVQVLICDSNGQVIADQGGQKARRSAMLPIEAIRRLESDGAGLITVDEEQWFASGARIAVGALDWRVIVMRPEALVYQPISSIVLWTTVSTGLLLILAYLLLMWTTRKLTRATEALSQDAIALQDGHMPAPRNFRVRELAELDISLRSMAGNLLQREALLKQSNEALEARVEERTLHLSKANAELGSAMQQLQQTQANLVQAGKMAALGSMVAGVAHEMNTPVGNARLAATSLVYRAQQLRTALDGGKVSRAEIVQCATDLEEGATLIDRSLNRAADLVQAFKQVAVDQTSNRRRAFLLNDIIHENHVLISPRLSQTSTTIIVNSAQTIEMTGYPGEIGQVLTNLIENAIVHGYADAVGGEIFIDAALHGRDMVRIQVRDHGRGIPAHALDRVFDPFFTSRMGQGGSGLGLSVTYGLVTQSLAGSISVESTVGMGTTFTLELPLIAPERAPNEVTEG